jgi:hypothetical protein
MVKTTKISGNVDYAKVPDRLKKFREDNPRAKVETSFVRNDDGSVDFKAYLLKDKADEYSADATGSASYSVAEMKPAKAFEKLETIAVGRALGLLGYLNNGEVATTEEMEEFNEYRAQKQEDAILSLQEATTIDDLKTTFISLGPLMANPKVVTAKDMRKMELMKEAKK